MHRRHCFVCGYVSSMICIDKDDWRDNFNYCKNCASENKYYISYNNNPVKPYRIRNELLAVKTARRPYKN